MNVSELIAELQELPQDLPVLRAKDDEGNGFDDVYEAGLHYWDGEDSTLHPDDADGTEDQVVVIW